MTDFDDPITSERDEQTDGEALGVVDRAQRAIAAPGVEADRITGACRRRAPPTNVARRYIHVVNRQRCETTVALRPPGGPPRDGASPVVRAENGADILRWPSSVEDLLMDASTNAGQTGPPPARAIAATDPVGLTTPTVTLSRRPDDR
jgi:hypothetical protein